MRQLSHQSRLQGGDTIIEVIFAIVIFAFVTISAIFIMNRGVATGERALEITLVRQQVNAQAEALRYIHAARVMNPSSDEAKVWNDIIDNRSRDEASEYGAGGKTCSDPTGNRFIMNARTATVWSTPPLIEQDATTNYPPYSQVVYDNSTNAVLAAYGIWIEAVPSKRRQTTEEQQEKKQFVDFHIRACWPAPGSDIPMTIGTIVRLYEPTV
jgi:type II secretory pathway pseudopilin PulG